MPLPPNAVERLAGRVGELARTEAELERAKAPTPGDYATTAALRLAKERRRPPRELAEELAAAVAELPEVERAEVAGTGFVNLWTTRDWYAGVVDEILAAGAGYGAGD